MTFEQAKNQKLTVFETRQEARDLFLKLIQAAPDLLNLLKDGLNLRNVEEETGDIVNWPKYWAEVEALIANAE